MISSEIKALKRIPKPNVTSFGKRLITVEDNAFLYQKITKCGCTYLRGLVFYLEHGVEIYDENDVKNPLYTDDRRASQLTNQQIVEHPCKFVVIRHPVKRFMSLYFDKFISNGDPMVMFGREFAENAGLNVNPGVDIAIHKDNCHKALDFLETDLGKWPHQNANWHWKPQTVRMSGVRDFKFNVLDLDGLDWQLPIVLGERVPEIVQKMEAVKSRNRSVKPVHADDVLDRDLRLRIRALYRADYQMYKEVRNFWRDKQV